MSTTTYLISGASRGLGLETARQLLALSTSNRIIAACRSPETANDLQELIQANPGRIEAVAIDVGDADTIKSGIATIGELGIAQDGIDVLINNAGIAPSAAGPLETGEDLAQAMKVNVTGAILLTQAALPLLRKGKGKKIFTTSSTMGSLTAAKNWPTFATGYCISKSAVNMYFVKLALELKPDNFTVILHCPGWVKTDMNGGVDGPAPLYKEDSVSKTISNVFGRGFEDTGKFINQDGEELPW